MPTTTAGTYRDPRIAVTTLLRGYCGTLAFGCALAAVIVMFAVSGVSLDAVGYHYDSEGGSALQKIHPSTLLLVVGLGFKVLARPTLQGLSRVFFDDTALLFALGGVVLAIVYIAAVLSVPMTPPIDSYLMPLLACFLLKDMSRDGLRLIAWTLVAFFVCNDLIAFYEAATRTHLLFVVPPDVTGHPEAVGDKVFDWKGHLAWDERATGMMGHPLDNALVTATFVMVLQTRQAAWIPAWVRMPAIVLSLAAMTAFGGRVALLVVVVMSLGLWSIRFLRMLQDRKRLPLRGLAGAFMIVPLALIGVSTLYSLGFFDRFLERFVNDDGSAETRLVMWRLFEPLSWSDVVFGPDQDVVRMWQRLQGLELGIESFWAGMPLGYGLAVMSVILTSWLAMFIYLAKTTTRAAWLAIVTFMIIGSTSAGLASKTVALGNMVVLVLAFLGGARRSGETAPRRRPAT